jgi:Cof subfamily protein (haloacid dehalogenase superfamily)
MNGERRRGQGGVPDAFAGRANSPTGPISNRHSSRQGSQCRPPFVLRDEPGRSVAARVKITRHTMPSNLSRNSFKTKKSDTDYSTHFFRAGRAHFEPERQGSQCPRRVEPGRSSNLDGHSHEYSRPARRRREATRYNVRVPIQMIAMDLDGTLLDAQSQLPAENARAIAEAAARGIEIVIVTGRRYHSARSIAGELGCDAHLIVSNGALIKSAAGETHYRQLLPAATARQVLDATAEFRSCAGVIFDRPFAKQIVFERVDWDGPFVGDYLRRHRQHVAEIDPLTECLDGDDPVEILFLDDCARINRAKKSLEALPFANEFTLALTEYPHRNLSMLDVLARGVNKGAALAELTRLRGIPRENVMAIGDNWNDREMLEYAGLPVVMGNSVPELKTLGWSVTLSNEQAGVAAAIDKHVLQNKGGMR